MSWTGLPHQCTGGSGTCLSLEHCKTGPAKSKLLINHP